MKFVLSRSERILRIPSLDTELLEETRIEATCLSRAVNFCHYPFIGCHRLPLLWFSVTNFFSSETLNKISPRPAR
jgi:hypothetical protein